MNECVPECSSFIESLSFRYVITFWERTLSNTWFLLGKVLFTHFGIYDSYIITILFKLKFKITIKIWSIQI